MVKPDYKGIIAEGKGQGAKETKTTVENERPYTKFYNDILEELIKAKIRIEAEHTYLAIMRKTTGFNKETDRIPLSQLQQLTGLSKRNVIRALDDLIKRNMIIKTKTDGFHCSYTLTDVNNWIKRVSPVPPSKEKKYTIQKKRARARDKNFIKLRLKD
ncbi:MAG: replication protein [Nitrospirae bacterium]|nr:replication protein [Nitrospirota bacterium]